MVASTCFHLQDPKNPGKNRGFAFVEYYNHACAEHARRVMSKPNFRLGSNAPTISWADPRGGADTTSMSQVSKPKTAGLCRVPVFVMFSI